MWGRLGRNLDVCAPRSLGFKGPVPWCVRVSCVDPEIQGEEGTC